MFRKVFKLLLVLIVSIMLIGCGAGEPSVAPDINDNIGSNEQIVIETTHDLRMLGGSGYDCRPRRYLR